MIYANACVLTHWGRVAQIRVSKLTIIGSENGSIIWTNDGSLSIGPLWTNFNGIFIKIHTFSFKKLHLKLSSGIWQTFCVGLKDLKRVNI